jgi:hypothetical protein
MGKSSIHLQTAKAGTIYHNSRENYSKSVVFTDEKNEIWNDSKTAYKLFREELEIRTKAYIERTGQKLHKKTSTMISGIVNLEQHHTLKDMEKIKDYLEEIFDTKVVQMGIHRDEGKLVNKENEDIKLASGINFFLNPNDNQLYFDNKFTKKINMEEWKIEKNYHGHFEMLGLDSQGFTLRKKMNIIKLSKLQDFTAQALGMERTASNVIVNEKGKAKRKTTNNKKRKDTNPFKVSQVEENKIKIMAKNEVGKIANEIIDKGNETIRNQREEKKKLKDELEELKKENAKIRLEFQTLKAERKDYASLEAENKSLQEQLKNKEIDLEKALEELQKTKEEILKEKEKVTELKDVLQEKEEELDHYGYRDKLQELKEVKRENKELKKELFLKNEENEKQNDEIDYYKSQLKALEQVIDFMKHQNNNEIEYHQENNLTP